MTHLNKIDYTRYFSFPSPAPVDNNQCLARCKLCKKEFKYGLTSKGNLHNHLFTSHKNEVNKPSEFSESSGGSISSNSPNVLESASGVIQLRPFARQQILSKSLVKDLLGEGGFPITIVEAAWFKRFMQIAQPAYSIPSKKTIEKLISTESAQCNDALIKAISKFAARPSITLDLWTGRNHCGYMAATVHFASIKFKDIIIIYI